MTKDRINAFLKFLFFLSLGLFLIWISTKSLTKEEVETVKNQILAANFKILVPSIVIILLSHFMRALRWRMMITPLSYKPSLFNVFLSVLIGFFFNLIFPRLGELMKCTLLGKHEKIPVDKLVGTMVAERLIDVFCLLLVISMTIISQYQRVGNYANELIGTFYKKIQFNITNSITVAVVFLIFLAGGFIIFKLFQKSKSIEKIKSKIKGILTGFGSIRKIEKKGLFIAYTISIWFLYLYCIKIGFLAINETSTLGWIPSLTILTFGSFAMIATQGGIGAYQLAVQKTLLLFGIREVTGLAFGWLMWSVQTIFLMITGPISLLIMSTINKKNKLLNNEY
jgi:uncharacterized protein (TIRG00374 family)